MIKDMKQINGDALATLNGILADIWGASSLVSAKNHAEQAIQLVDKEVVDERTVSFRTGPDAEKDLVAVEELLMKLALAETVIADMRHFIEEVDANDGIRPDGVESPDDWAVTGMNKNLFDVAHALKCGGWGYESAFLR